jgi:hypothetical protein
MPIDDPTTERAATVPVTGTPVTETPLPDLSHAKHKPRLHISAEGGDELEEDDLEIDAEELPVMGTDASRIP